MSKRVQTVPFEFGSYGWGAGYKTPEEMAKRVNARLDALQEDGYEILAVNLFEYVAAGNSSLGGLFTVRADEDVYEATARRIRAREEAKRERQREIDEASYRHRRRMLEDLPF